MGSSTDLVSVITPTWQRHGQLTERCIPSVCAQTWPHVEHLVISDGPDPALRAVIEGWQPHLRYAETAHGGHWGHLGRLAGIELAAGDWIAWLDDDDAYRPEHIEILIRACRDTGADFAYPRMLIGAQLRSSQPYRDDPAACTGGDGTVMSSMIFSRKTAFAAATWSGPPCWPDGKLIADWRAAGLHETSVPRVTVDMYTRRDA